PIRAQVLPNGSAKHPAIPSSFSGLQFVDDLDYWVLFVEHRLSSHLATGADTDFGPFGSVVLGFAFCTAQEFSTSTKTIAECD
ncbi:hypothetical protein ACTXJX_18935, partial [Glutamicibacter ardleyensis]|uniref:hypothetical protein n=1 Tax=Glutamicibacter ardleyensis TaxID=225894 RepID=UPI003FD407DD